MVSNLASSQVYTDRPKITIDLWRIACKQLYAFSRYIALNISNATLNIYIYLCINSEFLQIRSYFYVEYTCIYIMYVCFSIIDALSVYLAGPSTPPNGKNSVHLTETVNFYLESGNKKPDWVQVRS